MAQEILGLEAAPCSRHCTIVRKTVTLARVQKKNKTVGWNLLQLQIVHNFLTDLGFLHEFAYNK